MNPEEDGPDAILGDLRRVTDKAKESEQWSAAIRAIELRGRHFGLWDRRNGANSLGDAEDLIQRYKRARERAQEAAEAPEGENVVPLRSR